ncbi:hypothetical protein [Burkholderia ubonensis]|uniref:hypothetical protein n=1 Tax=Burkholderia ubonensis TaxID=101571 RepID=UPI0010544365|nr:hypothetical protein [Burkholderia ubonensis]
MFERTLMRDPEIVRVRPHDVSVRQGVGGSRPKVQGGVAIDDRRGRRSAGDRIWPDPPGCVCNEFFRRHARSRGIKPRPTSAIASDVIAKQGAINVLAGLETSKRHQESSSRGIGSNGAARGFSVGVASSHGVHDTASQTQCIRPRDAGVIGHSSEVLAQGITPRISKFRYASDALELRLYIDLRRQFSE